RIQGRRRPAGRGVGYVPGSDGPRTRDDVPHGPGVAVILGDIDGRESAGGPLRVRGERRRGPSSWIRRMNRQEWLALLLFLTPQRRGNHIHDDHGAESRGGARGRRRRRRGRPSTGNDRQGEE